LAAVGQLVEFELEFELAAVGQLVEFELGVGQVAAVHTQGVGGAQLEATVAQVTGGIGAGFSRMVIDPTPLFGPWYWIILLVPKEPTMLRIPGVTGKTEKLKVDTPFT